jgi:hypothetical protein
VTQDLAVQQNTLPANDGWEDTAAEASQRTIQGTLLKFVDGGWKVGREGTPLSSGRPFIALATTSAWVKWENNNPATYKLREPGKTLPYREDLGDEDEAAWEKGPDGQPRDPWQLTGFLYMTDESSAEPYTFSTSSWGGRGAISDLALAIKNKRFREPDAQPVVELESAPHKTKFGMKTKPRFTIVGWYSNSPPVAAQADSAVLRTPQKPKVVEADFDDEIPY